MDNNTGSDYKNLPAYKAGILIWKTVPPILLVFGTCGNVLSIVVLTGKSIRKSTTGLNLIVLTFSDLAVLYTGLLRQWIIYMFDFDVRLVSEKACKIHTWLVYSSLDFSAWLLIAVTLERIIAVWFPYALKSKCNRQNGAILTIGILISVLGLNSHFLYGMVFIRIDGQREKCSYIDMNYKRFMNIAWSWIDLCAFCLIPFSFIVVGNYLILFKVARSHRKAKPIHIHAKYKTSLKGRDNQQSSMTAILVTLNTVFLLTTLPISIYNIGHSHWSTTDDPKVLARLDLWWAIVNMLMYINNAVNFLLYSLSGSQFRQEAKRIFCDTNGVDDIKARSIIPSQGPDEIEVDKHESNQHNTKYISELKRESINGPGLLQTTFQLSSNSLLLDNKLSKALKHDSFMSEDEFAESQLDEETETSAPIADIKEVNRVSYVEEIQDDIN